MHRRMLHSNHITKHVPDDKDAYLITDCKFPGIFLTQSYWTNAAALLTHVCVLRLHDASKGLLPNGRSGRVHVWWGWGISKSNELESQPL